MVTVADPVAATPASVQGGVSFCGVMERLLNTFGCAGDSSLLQATPIATATRNTEIRTRFIAASRTDRGDTPDLIPATR
jgi:hypothetical protein